MLSEVRSRLQTVGPAGAGQLAADLEMDRESIEMALAYWMNRGKVRTVPILPSGCGGCTGCSAGGKSILGSCPSRTADAGLFSSEPGSFPRAYQWVKDDG